MVALPFRATASNADGWLSFRLIRDARQAFLAAEEYQHVENTGGSGLSGQRGAERLGDLGELQSPGSREILDRCLERRRTPIRHGLEHRTQLPQRVLGLGIDEGLRCRLE